MNFSHLEYFLMVAQELNITRAAERLYISQQALSSHINNLEKELQVKLFTRSPKLALTYAGEQLVQTATQILDLHSQFLAKVGDINRNYTGALRVGISHTCGLALLPLVLPLFRQEFPQVEFSLFEGDSVQVEDALAHNRVDVIICFEPIRMEGVETVPLTCQRLVLVVPRVFTGEIFGAGAEKAREQLKEKTGMEPFAGQPFVLLKKGNRTRNNVDRYFDACGFKPRLVLETENTVTTLALAQSGVGITICPELFLRAMPSPAKESGGVDIFPLAESSGFGRLVAAHRSDRYLSHFAERFIELVGQALAELEK